MRFLNFKIYLYIILFSIGTINSFSQSENLKSQSVTVLKHAKEMGYKPLATWYIKSNDFPLKNEVYLHGGNEYLIVGMQESEIPDLRFSFERLKDDDSKELVGECMADNGLRSLTINGKDHNIRQTYHLSFKNESNSNKDAMIFIAYKSKDNATTDYEKNLVENHYTGAEKKNWFALVFNKVKH